MGPSPDSPPEPPGAAGRRLGLIAAAGIAVAVVAIGLAAAAGPPYLALDALNPWLAVFAIALFCAMFALPFVVHARLGGALEADARWERALLVWGAIALGVLALGLAAGLPSGFGSDSLAGSAGLVIVVEAALVIGTLVVWLIAG